MNPQSNYDFILNPTQPPKSVGGGHPLAGKSMLMLGGVVVLLLIVFLIGMLSKGGGPSVNLTSLAETQTEIVRVATEANSNVTTAANQNLAINIELTVTSQLNALKSFLKSNGTKLSDKTLALKKNSSTDTQLTTAQQDSTYDTVFTQIMQTELANYLTELKTAYQSATGPKTRALLSTDYTQAAQLYQQIPSTSSNT